MNTRRVIILIFFFAILIAAVMAGALWRNKKQTVLTPTTKSSEHILVIATTFPIYDFVRTVIGDVPNMTVKRLLMASGPHDFTPTPETTALMYEANIIVKNGLGLDDFIEKLSKASGNESAVIINSSREVNTLETNGVPDPHIWLYPKNAIRQVKNIRDTISAINPDYKTTFEINAERYISRLNALDNAFKETIAAAPSKKIVTFHGAFRYLSENYGLEQVAIIRLNPEAEPSAQELSLTTELIKNNNIKTIFTEPQFSPRIVDTLASDLNLKIMVLDPIETGSDTDSYLSIMEQNLLSLKDGLK